MASRLFWVVCSLLSFFPATLSAQTVAIEVANHRHFLTHTVADGVEKPKRHAAKATKKLSKKLSVGGDGPSTTSKPLKDDTAAQLGGITQNGEGDFYAFLSALGVNLAMVLGFLLTFSYLRKTFPPVFSWNVLQGEVKDVKCMPNDSLFGWFWASWRISSEEVEKNAGLDAGMLVTYIDLCLKCMCSMAIPLCVVLAPMHIFLGGQAAHGELLSYPGLHNVQHGNWLCWVEAVACLLIVVGMDMTITGAHEKFVERRYHWLRSMPEPRCNTLLVEGIPPQLRSDKRLQEFFQAIVPESKVTRAYMVRQTSTLQSLIKQADGVSHDLLEARLKLQKTGKRPSVYSDTRTVEDAIDYYENQEQKLSKAVEEERKRIIQAAANADKDVPTEAGVPRDGFSFSKILGDDFITGVKQLSSLQNDGIFGDAGFVTFETRRAMELAVNTRLTRNALELNLSYPPDPSDVVYSGLQMDSKWKAAYSSLGTAALAGVFFGFMPFIVFFSTLTTPESLAQIPMLAPLVDMPCTQAALQGLGSVLAIMIFMSLLPTVLHTIFETFFDLKAASWAQLHVQRWYHYFLIVFVLLATAVGRSLWSALGAIIQDPTSIVSLLAAEMPKSSHWYLCYLCAQWSTHGMHFLRYSNLGKYLLFKKLYSGDVTRAHEKSEPEDQNYYGIGSRTARISFDMAVGLVFCTFNPIITLLTLVDFCILRLEYGYLLTFQESKKPDLGGVFWVNQLNFLYLALTIYSMMMCGVMLQWMDTEENWMIRNGPCMIASLGVAYVTHSWYKFQDLFRWETLPFAEVCRDKNGFNVKREQIEGLTKYEQKELLVNEQAGKDIQDQLKGKLASAAGSLCGPGVVR